MTIKVAIIGSGPSGFYTADSLLKSDRDVQIDIIERLPTPFGLIRGGVAPDHQTTKKVAKAYEKTALNDGVAYFGNVEVGKDISMDELREIYETLRSEDHPALPLRELSMGMTGDFEIAIGEGSNLVRIGTAIFGPRI